MQPVVNGTEHGHDVEMKEDLVPEASIPRSSPSRMRAYAALQSSTTPSFPPLATTELAPPVQPHSRTQTPPARGSPHLTPSAAPPSQPNPHGSSTRIYLNQNITPYLLEGMKYLAVYEPEKPLKWLSEFLERKSKEVEGG